LKRKKKNSFMLVSKPRIKKTDQENQAQTNRLVIILTINYSWKLDSDCFFYSKIFKYTLYMILSQLWYFSFQSHIKYKLAVIIILFLTKIKILVKNLIFTKINKRYVNKKKVNEIFFQNDNIFKYKWINLETSSPSSLSSSSF
jgi:hypothetical protein